MRILFWFSIGLITLLVGCSSGKQLTQLNDDARAAFSSGNYGDALAKWEAVIKSYQDQGKSTECPVYTDAGMAALELGNTRKGIQYLESAVNNGMATAETYAGLARSFQKIDNLSKEIMTLETYLKDFPTGTQISEIRKRTFKTYIESENWEKAVNIWPDIENEVKHEPEYLEDWFTVNKALDNTAICDKLAATLLEQNPKNLPANEWMGKKYFWKAENRYNNEMAAYEKKKTRKQYAILLKALDEVTADFKISLKYFDILYKEDPKPEYAKFIGNIYVRFNDKEKADYYLKKAGK